LNQVLNKHKQKIVRSWIQDALNTYPAKSAEFFSRQKDQFANPIGATLSRELEAIFEELLLDHSSDKLSDSVDAIVRFRAVQDFSPSQAVAFFWGLKRIVRKEAGASVVELGLINQLLAFEDRIDQLGMLAFEIYVKCREKIWELKAKEAQNRTSNLLKRKADVTWTVSDELTEMPPSQDPLE
jgi:hypothetical protein